MPAAIAPCPAAGRGGRQQHGSPPTRHTRHPALGLIATHPFSEAAASGGSGIGEEDLARGPGSLPGSVGGPQRWISVLLGRSARFLVAKTASRVGMGTSLVAKAASLVGMMASLSAQVASHVEIVASATDIWASHDAMLE